MKGTREEYFKKLKPHIQEVYDLHIKSLEIQNRELIKKANSIKCKMEAALKRKDSMIYNMSRATVEDLKSYHYLFFDCEGTVTE